MKGEMTIREKIVVGVATSLLAAMALAAYGLPTRIAVVETKQTAFEDRLNKFDAKLDRILDRVGRRQ